MGSFLKNMLKITIDIPYNNFTVYPTVKATKDAIIQYCNKIQMDYFFIENSENDSILVKLDGEDYEVLRSYGGRNGYGIRCRRI